MSTFCYKSCRFCYIGPTTKLLHQNVAPIPLTLCIQLVGSLMLYVPCTSQGLSGTDHTFIPRPGRPALRKRFCALFRIEPGLLAWQAQTLPLHLRCRLYAFSFAVIREYIFKQIAFSFSFQTAFWHGTACFSFDVTAWLCMPLEYDRKCFHAKDEHKIPSRIRVFGLFFIYA